MSSNKIKENTGYNLELLYDLEDHGKDKHIIISKFLNGEREHVIITKVKKCIKVKYGGYNTIVHYRKTKLENETYELDDSNKLEYSIKNPKYVEIIY